MDWKKSMWPAAAASLVAFTSVLSAAVDEAQVSNIENRVSCLEKTPCPGGCINPPARPQVQCGYNIFLGAEAIWWSAYEYGLEYALQGRNTTDFVNKGDTKDMGNEYSWGFRFGVGYNTPHDGWDLASSWTFFNNSVKAKDRAPNDGGLFPIWKNPSLLAAAVARGEETPNPYFDQASADWELELNIIDLELGREFFTSKYLTLRPHMGLRYIRVDQDYKVDYKGGSIFPGRDSVYSVRNSNDSWGFGLRGGVDTQWGLTEGFSIYGNFALALLHSHFHISQENYIRNRETRVRTLDTNFNNRKRVGRATTDLALGIRWDHMFEGDRFHLGLQFGWEHHMFFGQNQMWQQVNSQPGYYSKGNDELSTQGWTFAARFDF